MCQDTCILVLGLGADFIHSDKCLVWIFSVLGKSSTKNRNWRWSDFISIGELPWVSHNFVCINWKQATFCKLFQYMTNYEAFRYVAFFPQDSSFLTSMPLSGLESWLSVITCGWEYSWSPTSPCFCFTQQVPVSLSKIPSK